MIANIKINVDFQVFLGNGNVSFVFGRTLGIVCNLFISAQCFLKENQKENLKDSQKTVLNVTSL